MHSRRSILIALGSAYVPCSIAAAQAKPAADEASLRVTIERYVAAWNRHDVKAWSKHLADDVWYTEAVDYYQRFKGRQAVVKSFADLVKTSDLRWDIKKIKMMPDGTATVVVGHFALMLPKKGKEYASSFESSPSISRWRSESGQWRMFYFTSHKGTALSEMQKDGVT